MKKTLLPFFLPFIAFSTALADMENISSIVWSGAQDIWIPWSGQTDVFIDINDDGISDLEVYYSVDGEEVIVASTVGDAEGIWGSGWLLGDFVPLNAGDPISEMLPSGQSWDSGSDVLVEYNRPVSEDSVLSGAGPWAGVEYGYMGIRFEVDGETHYGWACLSVSDEYVETYIHDWAYNDVPGEGIYAGQIPEPSSILLFGFGAGLIGLFQRRLRRSNP